MLLFRRLFFLSDAKFNSGISPYPKMPTSSFPTPNYFLFIKHIFVLAELILEETVSGAPKKSWEIIVN